MTSVRWMGGTETGPSVRLFCSFIRPVSLGEDVDLVAIAGQMLVLRVQI